MHVVLPVKQIVWFRATSFVVAHDKIITWSTRKLILPHKMLQGTVRHVSSTMEYVVNVAHDTCSVGQKASSTVTLHL